ncbi:sugar phosphate isomerase/epimerase family protein [Haladaptatus halobius]|uniref:sugar phosphate isomerase/epimerase family protein n=1 Tax=Haladaptatus halobius TaxID=2884875 RepID=UPI001D0B0542|nr:sugar phosphate isomerase/epimerase [Haladaptatus halobius]
MKVAGSTLLYSRLSLNETCRRLSDLGFDAIDVGMQEGWAHVAPSEAVGAVDAAALRIETACTEANIDPVAINVSAGEVDLDTEIERVKAVADVADALDIDVVTLPAAQTDTLLAADLDRFSALVDAVADRDVILTVETHWGTHTEEPAVAAEYAAAVPGLAYTLDPGHYFIGNHDIQPPYRDLLADIEHVHIRQAGIGWEEIQQPVQDGSIDIEAFIDDLRGAEYDGVVTVEYIDSLENVDPQAAQCQAVTMREVLRECLK